MKTKVFRITPQMTGGKEFAEACRILQEGGLVAFPTETVYGLGGDALKEDVAAKIYEAKGRPSDNPLIVHIADTQALWELAASVPDKACKLAEKFWPGPLTMILPKSELVPMGTTGGLSTVAVRMPEHPLALELIRKSGVYVAAPSANTSGRPSPTRAEHVIEDLSGKIDCILDGGAVGIGLESTIIDLTSDTPMILRPGAVTKSMLEAVVGEVEYDPAVISREMKKDVVAKAPGMKYRHYAPQGEMIIVEGEPDKVVAYINEQIADRLKKNPQGKIAVIASVETGGFYNNAIVRTVGSREDEKSVAAGLYDVLRQMDSLHAEYIYAESFCSEELGQAIMNRMRKAAGYHIVNV